MYETCGWENVLRCTIDCCYHIYKFLGVGWGKCTFNLWYFLYVLVCFDSTAGQCFWMGWTKTFDPFSSKCDDEMSTVSRPSAPMGAVKEKAGAVSLTAIVSSRGVRHSSFILIVTNSSKKRRIRWECSRDSGIGIVVLSRSYGILLVLVKVHCTQSSTIRTCHHHLFPG